MSGHVRARGRNSWELKFDAGRDPATGRRRIQYVSFKGTKRQAQVKLAELIAAVGKGTFVDPVRTTSAIWSPSASICGGTAAGSAPRPQSATSS
jgi:hypothetical protein